MAEKGSYQSLLPHLFRQEYAKMTAVLCRYFGLENLAVAEDIASDTFLKASEYWAIHGVPASPEAWLYTVARNKAKDRLKHDATLVRYFQTCNHNTASGPDAEIEFTPQLISDSQLAMIFVVCNPANPEESQVALALQILCGFSVEEIANAFLTQKETIKKRLQRARDKLRKENFQIHSLSETEVKSRLDTVLKTMYLLFNEGYFSNHPQGIIRKSLCTEAVRLTFMLAENTLTRSSQTFALLALLCFQSSRLDARTDAEGKIVLYGAQDQKLWDQELINRGNYYLVQACSGNDVSKYHLEAGIAYWHTTPTSHERWRHILHLYDQLICIEYSPVTALNRAFAYGRVHGHEAALQETLKLELPQNRHYQALLGYLYADNNPNRAIDHYRQAVALTSSDKERQVLLDKITQLLKSQENSRENGDKE